MLRLVMFLLSAMQQCCAPLHYACSPPCAAPCPPCLPAEQKCAQVLLTLDNLANRSQYINAKNTFEELLRWVGGWIDGCWLGPRRLTDGVYPSDPMNVLEGVLWCGHWWALAGVGCRMAGRSFLCVIYCVYFDRFEERRVAYGRWLSTCPPSADPAPHRLQPAELQPRLGAIPIVNENDTVAVQELRIGDNDTLSAQVRRRLGGGERSAVRMALLAPQAHRQEPRASVAPGSAACAAHMPPLRPPLPQVATLVQADWLFLLTDVPNLFTANPNTDPDAQPIYEVADLSKLHVSCCWMGCCFGVLAGG